MKKNNKGFTLIELLAVIVVLAIIMVIATTQINRTIKKSRADAFVSSYQMLYKTLKSGATSGLSREEIIKEMDYSPKEFDVALTVGGSSDYALTVCTAGIKLESGAETGTGTGKFANMNLTDFYNPSQADGDKASIGSNIGSDYTVKEHCITSSYSS